MAENMNDDFDIFNSSDDFSFGGDASDDFGNNFSNGNGFSDDNSDVFENDDFGESLNNLDSQNQFQDSTDEQQGIKKQAIIFIVVGIAILAVVLIVAVVLGKKSDKKDNTQIEVQYSNINVDNIMNDGNKNKNQNNQTNNQQNIITNKVDNKFTWTLITDNEKVQFNDEYSDMTFTVTCIEHKARAVDTNNNLVVITSLQGSISGLSGTYELDVPYNKGVKLVVGNSFTVHVQLGTYNGKTVVGEIQY